MRVPAVLGVVSVIQDGPDTLPRESRERVNGRELPLELRHEVGELKVLQHRVKGGRSRIRFHFVVGDK